MIDNIQLKINFTGGIISPGKLHSILEMVEKSGVNKVSFGLRQQLIIHAIPEEYAILDGLFKRAGIEFETGVERYPNIVSSYPAEEIFITKSWLSEGVYKDIFDGIATRHRLKINVSDSNQSFTPLLTGNINWVASKSVPHFWHLLIRFPKTNNIYEWDQLVYTNDLARLSHNLETLMFKNPAIYFGNPDASGDKLLTTLVSEEDYNLLTAESTAVLPQFNLPYYEGLNRHDNKYWLGIYRRNEFFETAFLKQVCQLCLETKIGQICSTPWKTIIIKGIEEKDKSSWNTLLIKFQVNVRHAANELNFQVEDYCQEALTLKNYLVKHLNNDDTRSFGLCIGIKTKTKSEVFSSILVRRKPLLKIAGIEFFYVYDILCARNYNPNERTGEVFSSNNPRFLLPEQLRRAILDFGKKQIENTKNIAALKNRSITAKSVIEKEIDLLIHQCPNCLSVYDDNLGEPENGIAAGTGFAELPLDYSCSICETPAKAWIPRRKLDLFQAV